MIFTDEQFAILSQFEENFRQVLDLNFARNISDRDADTLGKIWHSTNDVPPRRYTCQQCKFNLLKQLGTAYRKDKAERETQKATETAQKSTETKKTNKVSTKKRKSK